MSEEQQLPTEITFQIDFNLHWVPAALGLNVPPSAAAAMCGITEAQLTAYIAAVEAEIEQRAESLPARPELRQALERLALPLGGTVLAIGDSITTYRYSYARLLEAVLRLHRPQNDIRFNNLAQSGYTSTHGLECTYTQFLALQPHLVFIKFGVNDCKRFGGPGAKMLVSLDEYRANILAMVEAFLNYTPANLVLLTPTPVLERVVNHNPDFIAMRMTWSNADIRACAEVVRSAASRHKLPLVDLVTAFGDQPDPLLYLPDGLHPSPAGHQFILETVLNSLAGQ